MQSQPSTVLQHDFMEPQELPQERIAKVKPFWELVPQGERQKLLSIPLSELKQRAAEVGAMQRKEQRLQKKGGQDALASSSPWPVELESWARPLDELKRRAAGVRQAAEQGAGSSLLPSALSAAQTTPDTPMGLLQRAV